MAAGHRAFSLFGIQRVKWKEDSYWFPHSRFHGSRRHLGGGANTTKFTANVWKNRDFDAR